MEKFKCAGFKAAGVSAGIKKKTGHDLGIIFSEVPASAAAVYTRNRVLAAPLVLNRERLKSGQCRAVIVNSGNANCCTGEQGLKDAAAMTRLAASALGVPEELVCAASTGVIGQPMPMTKVEAAVPGLVKMLHPEGWGNFARAIMTTDLVPKIASSQGRIDGRPFTVMGVAKGSGMIRPDMATMLCFVCTDAQVRPDILQTVLRASADISFNRITVDGDTSTNDIVLLMANGLSNAAVQDDAHRATFQAVLDDVMIKLAKMVVKDGEGATKLVEIIVTRAASDRDARLMADAIANSNLVKTALFGQDANWGRILAAAGRAGADMNPEQANILFDDVMMVKDGIGMGPEAEARATKVLRSPEFSITLDLKNGTGRASVFTCDFSIDYVKINADYRS
jgi:glutamate N-acetyltransferase/amino-acid N-acetyltransferase